MAITKIPPVSTLQDGQFIQVAGPDGITTAFLYDQQQRALYFKESQVIYPSFHGITHIGEDPIPSATCDTPGLMAPDDKCKLDALLQTRLGVLGFQGAGFPDDGGWMQGDIILAAGTEFISLERIGNVVRFTVDSPIPLVCNCEECTQIFWIQDETDISSIRPPTCSGKLPGANLYGELKVYLFPESTIADPLNTAATLNNKGQHPALIFKRYDDTIVPGAAEFELILKRNANNNTITDIGWAMTPGAAGKVECVWFTGRDNDGNLTRFDLSPEADPNLLGYMLYKGHLITKQMAVITDYTQTVLSTNTYTLRMWDINNERAVGQAFTAKNVWAYLNPENPASGANPKSLITDNSIDILPIGTLVELWFFQVGVVSGSPVRRYYFSKKPAINPNNMWSWVGQSNFGDIVIAREEVQASGGSEDKDAAAAYSAIRDFESDEWGLTGQDDPVLAFDVITTAGTEGADFSKQHRAVFDTSLPGLKVVSSLDTPSNFSERPVYLWNRTNLNNAVMRLAIGAPASSAYTPYDILIRAPIDRYTEKYMQVMSKGIVNGLHYIRVCGVNFDDLPPFGTVRIISPGNNNIIYNYGKKFVYPSVLTGEYGTVGTDFTGGSDLLCNSIILAGGAAQNEEFLGAAGDILELVHQEYSCNVVRVEFSYESVTQLLQVQFKVGFLDMSLPYEGDTVDDTDDFVRGLSPGYAVSAIYSQAGTFSGVGTQPAASPSGFVAYNGGAVVGGAQSEYWNTLEIMHRDNQVWIWWNRLLIPPSTLLSGALPTPVSIDTPYYPVTVPSTKLFGKYGVRMWPGASIRNIDVKTQANMYSEFTYGQLALV